MANCLVKQSMEWKQSIGVDAWQPWGKLRGTCDIALTTFAKKYQLPADIFHKGTHKGTQMLPAKLWEPYNDLPGPPPAIANI